MIQHGERNPRRLVVVSFSDSTADCCKSLSKSRRVVRNLEPGNAIEALAADESQKIHMCYCSHVRTVECRCNINHLKILGGKRKRPTSLE